MLKYDIVLTVINVVCWFLKGRSVSCVMSLCHLHAAYVRIWISLMLCSWGKPSISCHPPRHLTPPARTGSGLPSVGCCNPWIGNCCWMQPRPRPWLSNFHMRSKQGKVWKMSVFLRNTYTYIHIYRYMYTHIYLYIYINEQNNDTT